MGCKLVAFAIMISSYHLHITIITAIEDIRKSISID